MTKSRTFKSYIGAAAVVPLAALTLAACGSNGGSATASSAPPTTPAGARATVGVANTDLGKILVDSQGRTLYLFQKDAGTKSACTGACATAWPPLRDSHKPVVGSGATASMVTTAPRSDGSPQVVYHGHPLYLFSGDSSPGDTNGQGSTAFGGAWYAVSPTGATVTTSNSSSSAGSSGY